MKFFQHTLRRSLAGCLAGAGLLGAAQAATLYDSGGFESPVFLVGQELDGQDPAAPLGSGPWARDNGTSRAVISATNAIDGTKSVKITRDPGATGATRWGVVKPVAPAAPDNVVDIRFDMQLVRKPYDFGPYFGVEAYDASSGTPRRIASLLHDASTGELVCHEAGTGRLVGTGHYSYIPRHQHYRLSLNFSARTFSIWANGRRVHTAAFVDPAASQFTDAPLVTLGGGEGTAYIDNYRIDRSTSRLPYLTWRGDGAGNVWSSGGPTNWFDGIGPAAFANGDAVRIDGSGPANPVLQLQGNLAPSAITVAAPGEATFSGSGTLTGTTGLLKEGPGTLTLAAAHTFSGGTAVTAGTLRVSNAAGSATGSGSVSLSSQATLTGSGRIGGSVSAAPGAVISPGNGIGTLEINGSLTLDEAVLEFDLGSASDRLLVGGDLALGGTLRVRDGGNFGPGSYPLIQYSGTCTPATFVLTDAPAGYDYRFSTATAGTISLIVTLPPPAPAAPAGLAATAAGKDAISLTWTDRSDGEDRFIIERGEPGLSFAVIAATAADATAFTDGGLPPGKTYVYRVRAENNSGSSAWSAEATATTLTGPALAWLKFDEGAGSTAADSSPHGNDATLTGAAAWGEGRFGGAIDLDGVDDHAALPGGLLAAATDFTISTWVNLDSRAGWSRIFDFGTDTTSYMFLSPANGATGTVRFAITVSAGAGEQIIDGTSPLPLGTWTHVAVTRSGNVGTLYVNGTAVGSHQAMTLTPARLGAAPNSFIGKSQWPDPLLDGRVDEFQVHDRAFSATEIAALADAATPRAPDGLVVTAGDGRVELAWAATAGATSYSVYRALGNGYELVVSGLTAPEFTDTGLVNGAEYRYLITASNGSGESGFSAVISARPMPAADYSGRAVVASVQLPGAPFLWGDTGELEADGGAREASFLTLDEGVVAGEIGHATVIGQGDRTRAEASVGGIVVNAGGVIIEAGFAMARALAVYESGYATGLAGGSELADLTVAGVPVLVTGEPNQTLNLPNGTLVVNEQIRTETAITVNALRITLDGGGEVVIASARAGYHSIEPPPLLGDERLSGGGWISTAAGAKATFCLDFGRAGGGLTGHLTFKDHGTGMAIKATAITAYGPGASPGSRRIEGTAEVDKQSGFTFVLEAEDRGEPGDADTLQLRVSNGYEAAGTLGGGNLQLHQPGN